MTKIDMIREQKQNVILEMPRFAYHSSEIDQNRRGRRGKENKVSRGIWEVVENKIGKKKLE